MAVSRRREPEATTLTLTIPACSVSRKPGAVHADLSHTCEADLEQTNDFCVSNVLYSSVGGAHAPTGDRKSTRLNSSHGYISYAVFCLKKKKTRYMLLIRA